MGVDLLDFYRGKMSLRRLLWLIEELPQKSLLIQELAEREIGDDAKLDGKDYFLTLLANMMAENNYLTSMLVWIKGGGKGTKPQPPDTIYPPGYQPPKPQFASALEIHQFLSALT